MFTRSPATIPWSREPSVTAASPLNTPARAWTSGPRARTASTSSRAARTARSGSSSRATGAPQTAMTASPMNFSTVPPYRPMTVRASSKYSERSSRTASASRPSAIVVNPTRSANSTVTKRRSATGAACAAPMAVASGVGPRDAAAAASSLMSRVPHSPQKRAWGGLVDPHVGQAAASLEPHSWQNLRPASLTVPHAGHCIRGM